MRVSQVLCFNFRRIINNDKLAKYVYVHSKSVIPGIIAYCLMLPIQCTFFYMVSNVIILAVTCDFQQCDILISVDSDEPVQPSFKLRNSKYWSVSSLSVIEYSSD